MVPLKVLDSLPQAYLVRLIIAYLEAFFHQTPVYDLFCIIMSLQEVQRGT